MEYELEPTSACSHHIAVEFGDDKQVFGTIQGSTGPTSSSGLLLQGAGQFLWEMPEPELDKFEAANRLACCATKCVL